MISPLRLPFLIGALLLLFASVGSAQAPVADFSGTPLSGNAPLLVAFTDLSTGSITGWSWDFGDGGTSTFQNPSHSYASAGSYSVSLTVTGPGGTDTLTRTDYVVVANAPPTADFVGAPTAGVSPLTVSFVDQSSGLITSRSWNFGDGGTSTALNPTHVYANAGSYAVSLTVTGTGGTDTLTRVDYIAVSAPAPVAAFSGSPTSGVLPLTVGFTDQTSGGPVTSWSWTFGDGGTSVAQNPSHTYNSSGTYSVSLTVVGPGGTDTATRTNYITVADQAPVVSFSGAPTSGVRPLAVAFTNLTSGGPVNTWAWSFGDGGTSAAQSPTYTYQAPGNYTVSLTATGPGGTDTDTRIDYITVNDPAPIAGFSGTPRSGVVPFDVTFADTSTGGPITTWSWSFGDGGTSSDQNPVHTYTVAGTYDVALTVTGPGGTDTLALTAYIDAVDPAPVAAFTGTPRNGQNPLTVSFTDLSTGPITSRLWDFGDGATSTATNPTHVYTTDGYHTVSLTVTGPGGMDTLTEVNYVGVGNPPTAAFVGAPRAGTVPHTVTFTDLSAGTITGWLWDFGNGNTSTTPSPQHTYTAIGTYTVSLTVFGPGGSNTGTRVDYITVISPDPVASFTGTPTSGTVPLTVSFTDTSIGDITNWAWDFGDGGTSSLADPTHTYASSGTYDVSLTVSGPTGSDTQTRIGYISVSDAAPVASFVGAPLSGPAPLTVSFTDTSAGAITSWSWNFGDGGTSTASNPTYTYSTSGSYTVSLVVSGPGGSDIHTEADYVAVGGTPPTADFVGNPRSGTAPLTVQFSDLSTGDVTGWFWDFGDGMTSTAQSPQHTYASNGSYDVSLTASGPSGTDSITRTGYIFVGAPLTLADGSFEGQTPGTPPGAPWTITQGTLHVIEPTGAPADSGMPTEGTNWLEVNTGSISVATPPSNPGGLSSPPVGASGVMQSFSYAPGQTVLYFNAAFILGEPANSAATNDFMSVDVTDGSTNYNLNYADTFTATPLTSVKYGAPMTAVATVAADLAALFPASNPSTIFTVSFQVGNGGNQFNLSAGYVDRVGLANSASTTTRNGTGVNPQCFSAITQPALGTTWVTRILHAGHPGGSTFTVLHVRANPSPGVPTQFGEILVGSGKLMRQTVPSAGTFNDHSSFAPVNISYVGLTASCQGLIVGGSGSQLCNALDITIGF